MKKHILLLLVIILTIGFASVSVNLVLSGKTSVAFDKDKLQVIFTRVRLNNEESENIIITDDGKSFVYIADDLTNVGDTSNIEYDIKNGSSIYDASVVVSCTTDNGENIEYNGNTLNQLIEVSADDGYTDTLTTKLTKVNASSNSLALKCTLIVNPLERDTIMLGKEYNITFDANGGSTIDTSVIVSYYEKYGELPIPVKKGYEFLGWYTESGEKIDSSSLVKVKDNHTLIAKWKENIYQLINDIDGDGIADVGDEIKVGTESFYVISYTDTELNALAKYNLKVGGIYNGSTLERTIQTSEEGYGRQDASMVGYAWQENKKYGVVPFSKTYGWPNVNNATIDIRNEAYRVGSGVTSETMTTLDALYGESGYEKYIQETIPSARVRLINKGEIEELINDGNELSHGSDIETKAKAKGYSWLYSTTYWTESSHDSSWLFGVYSHGSKGNFSYLSWDSYSDNQWYGVRPVITVKNNLVNSINITFDANGGNAIDVNKEIEYGKAYGELPIPTHNNPNYTFAGWHTEKGEKVESTTIMKKYQNHTLIARWKDTSGYEIMDDANRNGMLDIGEEIIVGTENFYVISITDTEINALAKYNLNVGSYKNPDVTEGIQHETVRGWVSSRTTYGTVKFSNSNGWPNENNATIDIRNETYGDGPVKEALYGENGYEKYIKETIPSASVRLITKREIEVLVNDGNELSYGKINDKANTKGYSWLYSTSYWTQSAGTDYYVWHVASNGSFAFNDYDSGSSCGVRPVITIPLGQ